MKASTSFGIFAKEWDKEVSSKSPGRQATLRGVLKLLGSPNGQVIYEIACGNGFLARKLVSLGAKEVWASDIAMEMIRLSALIMFFL